MRNFLASIQKNPSEIGLKLGAIGFVLAILGCFAGNALIGTAQGVIILAIIFHVVGGVRTHRGHGFDIRGVNASWFALVILVLMYVISFFFNWEETARYWKDLKKLRYQVLVLAVLAIPLFRRGISAHFRIQRIGLGAVIVSSVVVCLAGWIGWQTGFHPLLLGDPTHMTRVSGVSGSVMSFAHTLQPIALMGIALTIALFRGDNWAVRIVGEGTTRRWFVAAAAGFLCLSLFFTYCRGPLLGFGFGLMIMLVLLRSIKLWCIAAAVIVGAGIYGYQSESRYFKNFSLSEGFQLRNDGVRIDQWKAAGLTFIDNPLVGIGHRQFEKRSVELKKEYGFAPTLEGEYFEGHAHNNYLEAFASTGFIGGLAFLSFCAFWLRETLRSRSANLYFFPAVSAFIVSGFFENTFTDSEVLHTILMIYFVSQIVLEWEFNRPEAGSRSTIDEAGTEECKTP